MADVEPSSKRAKIEAPLVSILTCCYNGGKWLDSMIPSILGQTWKGPLELCVFDDASTDDTLIVLEKWRLILIETRINLVIGSHKGVGEELRPVCHLY